MKPAFLRRLSDRKNHKFTVVKVDLIGMMAQNKTTLKRALLENV
ncbi:MAG: hypothetical protein NT070_03365 [Cyanobacteria bacterium]|nr:hypothetical protein [Cyanobacteriota bacterium]